MKVLKYTGEFLEVASELIALAADPADPPGEESKAGPAAGIVGALLGISSELIESFGDTTNPTGELKDTVDQIWVQCWDSFFNLDLVLQNIFAIIQPDIIEPL